MQTTILKPNKSQSQVKPTAKSQVKPKPKANKSQQKPTKAKIRKPTSEANKPKATKASQTGRLENKKQNQKNTKRNTLPRKMTASSIQNKKVGNLLHGAIFWKLSA